MPSSARKIASARANGAKSRGRATEAGKHISSLNATTHGLTAQTVVLFNESADEYQSHLRDYLLHFGPKTKPEDDLVHQLAAAHWRLARYAGVESGLLEQRMHDQAERYADDLDGQPEYHRVALAFKALSESNGSLSLLNRYQARLHREYQRILKTLLEIETARLKESRNAKLQNGANPESEHSADDSADAPVLPLVPAPMVLPSKTSRRTTNAANKFGPWAFGDRTCTPRGKAFSSLFVPASPPPWASDRAPKLSLYHSLQRLPLFRSRDLPRSQLFSNRCLSTPIFRASSPSAWVRSSNLQKNVARAQKYA